MANYELSNIAWKGNTYTVKDNSALHQSVIGSWTPDFANLKPLATYEYDISSTSYFKICERPNVTSIKDIADEVLAFRITVTGTNIFSVADVLVRAQPTVNVRPLVAVNYQTQSTSAGTTGIRYLRTVNPKAANTSYKYEIAIAAYNSTKRHIKVEVFKTTSDWTFSSAATVYSYNSTYQTASDLTLYTSIGIFYNYTFYATANYANYAGYKSTWDGLFNGQGNFLAAGVAIAANQFVFIGKDNKVYPTTSTSVEIDPAWPIAYCTTAHAANASVTWSAIRSWGYFTPASSILKDGTLVAAGTVYMRCSYRDGKLYSDNTMTQNLTPDDLANGNAFIKLGKMYTATAVAVNTYNSEYFTLDTDGHIKALNGYLFNAENASVANAVKRQYNLVGANDYPILFDSNPSSNITTATTIPSLTPALKYNPSTGNLSSTLFTGSGAGLTDISSSSVDFDDLPTKADYEGPSGTGRFLTFLQNESGDTYTHPYLLETPAAMAYRVGSDSIWMGNGLGVGRQKIGLVGSTVTNTNANAFACCLLKTPIEIDQTTYAPINSLFTDGIKLSFRVVGNVIHSDNSISAVDTYFAVAYSASTGWSVSYKTVGDYTYRVALATEIQSGKLTFVVGPAASKESYDIMMSNFKAFSYYGFRLDYIGATGSYPSGTTDMSNLIETTSGWSSANYRVSSTETVWEDVFNDFGIITGTFLPDPYELLTNKVASISSASTDDEYPSAKAVYDAVQAGGGGSVSKMDLAVNPFYGTCSTAASTAAKTVTVDSSFQLADGVRVRVYMEKANTNTAPTLNVNGTGAKSISIQGPYGTISNVALSAWYAGAFSRGGWYEFFYAASYNSGNGRWIIEDSPAPIRLANFAAGRLTTINSTNGTLNNGGIRYTVVANGATGNPFGGSAAVLWLSHDTSTAYTRQIALSTNTPPHMAFRSQDSSGGTSWQPWEYVLTAANQYDSHMATLAYTASGLAFSNNALTIPIDGTQYKILQINIFNNDLSYGLGWPRTFIFNASGTNGCIENTSMYCMASSAASGITVTFDSSWSVSASTNVDITVLYRRIS